MNAYILRIAHASVNPASNAAEPTITNSLLRWNNFRPHLPDGQRR
ncbi:MAG TPA: hypothetical protein VL171_00460 [Verrucomicrobiae bacterium]|nr:hypothetical protein [Verrucomicrobiae bacterium]